ncbi:MAG: reverse transcriptase family protein, partial [Eubacteriaceae bacterium]
MEPYHVDLKPGSEPYHARAFPIPKAYEDTLKMEVDRLCELGVLKKVNRSAWGAPTFIIPKHDGTVRFISDFRELNKRILRHPFPIPKIQDLLQKLQGFRYGTSLDLNMGYYHIELDLATKELCTIVLPWGKYEYQRLPMGLNTSVDLFQEKMSQLLIDLEYVRTYLDDILCLTKGTYKDHLEKLSRVFSRLREAGLKVNAKKCSWAQDTIEYLGYLISRQGIAPIPKKVEAIGRIQPPKNRRQLRSFIGMVNYYRDMWPKRSELLAPLTALTSATQKFEWREEHQKAFEDVKNAIIKDTLLAFPQFDQEFDIHTDASHLQLGSVITQNGKPLAFYS